MKKWLVCSTLPLSDYIIGDFDFCFLDFDNKFGTFYNNLFYNNLFYNNLDSSHFKDIITTLHPQKPYEIMFNFYLDFVFSCIINQVSLLYDSVFFYTSPLIHKFHLSSLNNVSLELDSNNNLIYGNLSNVRDSLNYFFDIDFFLSFKYRLNRSYIIDLNSSLRNISFSCNKWCIFIFGVIGRSIRNTIYSFKNHVFNVLDKHNINYHIFIVNNNIENMLIDGVPINNDDFTLIPFDFHIELFQSHFSSSILQKYPRFHQFLPKTSPKIAFNGFRQLYIESIVASNINTNSYSKCLAFTSDLFFIHDIPVSKILNSSFNEVIVSANYSGRGITNGVYLGCPHAIKKLLSHYHILNSIRQKRMYNYEYIIKLSAQHNNIVVNRIDFKFIKIRANNSFNLHRLNREKSHDPIYSVARRVILNHSRIK